MRATRPPVMREVSAGEPFPRCLGEKTRTAFALGLGGAVDAGEQLLVKGNVDANRFAGEVELDRGHQCSIGKIGHRLRVCANGVDIAHDRKNDPFARQCRNMSSECFTSPAQRLIKGPAARDAAREVWKRNPVSSRFAVNKCNDSGHARLPSSVLRSHHSHPATR